MLLTSIRNKTKASWSTFYGNDSTALIMCYKEAATEWKFLTCNMALSQARAKGSDFSAAQSSGYLCRDRDLFSWRDNTVLPFEDQNDEMPALCEIRMTK